MWLGGDSPERPHKAPSASSHLVPSTIPRFGDPVQIARQHELQELRIRRERIVFRLDRDKEELALLERQIAKVLRELSE